MPVSLLRGTYHMRNPCNLKSHGVLSDAGGGSCAGYTGLGFPVSYIDGIRIIGTLLVLLFRPTTCLAVVWDYIIEIAMLST